MYWKGLVIFGLLGLISGNAASDLLKQLPKSEGILQTFLNLVQTHQMNISVVTSHEKHFSNGKLRDLRDNILLIQPNNVLLTESQLTAEIGQQWLKGLNLGSPLAIATYRNIVIQNGVVSEQNVLSSNLGNVPVSPSFENLLLPEQNGLVQGLSYIMMYNYSIPNENGQNQTISVLAANLNITVQEISPKLSLQSIEAIKPKLMQIWMTFDYLDDIYQHFVDTLNNEMPVPNSTWQLLSGSKVVSIPKNSQYVKLQIENYQLLLFTMETQD